MKHLYFFIVFSLFIHLNAFSQKVLIIWDDTSNTTYTINLRAALKSQGMTVVFSNTIEYNYNGTNPSPNGYCAVIHLDGLSPTYSMDMPLAGQNALVNYVQNGGVFIHTEWDAYEYWDGRMQNMRDLILFDRSANGYQGTITYNKVIAHPVVNNVPASFAFTGYVNIGSMHTFAVNPSTLLMTDNNNSAAVAVRNFGLGRIIGFNHGGNYLHATTLSNANIKQLFIDAIKWGTGGCTAKPVITIQPVSAYKCAGQNATFNITTSCASYYQWLQNGVLYSSATTAPLTITNVSFSDTGAYRCRVINACGRDSSVIVKLGMAIPVSVKCSPASRAKCGGDTALFRLTVIGSGTFTYHWRKNGTNINGDTLQTLAMSNLSPADNGVYTCVVYGPCSSDTSKPAILTVNPKPTPLFTVNDTSQCLKTNVFVLNNSSTITSGSITSYLWKFGDGGTSNNVNPTYIYNATGTFILKLIATSDKNCKDSLAKNVYVNVPPAVSYSINDSDQCLKGNNFIFTNNSSISSGTLTYKWSFGDGSVTNGAGTKNHSYLVANNYQVKLVATSNKNCKDSVTKNTYVFPGPKAGFVINDSTQCTRGNHFVFTSTSSISSGSIKKYNWNFGDSGSDTNSGPVIHTYLSPDTFKVRLIITSDKLCKDTFQSKAYVYAMPHAMFSINDSMQCLGGNNFIFTNSSTINTGILNNKWEFGDGMISVGAGSKIHDYSYFDTFQVKLIATSQFGCSDSITKNAYVTPAPITSFFINNNSQCINNNLFVFTNTSSIPFGNIQNYKWDFGDGGTAIGAGPENHNYTSIDSFKVKLILTSGIGCKDSLLKMVYINPLPVSGFTINNVSQCLGGNNFVFKNKSTINKGVISNTFWQFGDGGISNKPDSINHKYTSVDTFNVRLKVTSSMGCSDSVQKQVYIRPIPFSDFNINNPAQCLFKNSFNFTNITSIAYGTFTYQWNTGDGFNSGLKDITHSYLSIGTFNVKLTSISNYGCKDSIINPVVIFPMPKAGFNINDSSQCLPVNNFIFTSTSKISSGTIKSYLWDLGDKTFSNSTTPFLHNYLTSDTFRVRLYVTSAAGCIDSISKNAFVNPEPVAGFNINNQAQCLKGNLFDFTNTTKIKYGSMIYQWDFGDKSKSTVNNPVHSYSSHDTFLVKLNVESNKGCIDSAMQNVYIFTMPKALLSVNTSEQCLTGNNFIFNNNSSIPYGNLTYQWNLGDGCTSNNKNVTHTYKTDNKYAVSLITSSNFGCADTSLINIIVHPMPKAVFAHSQPCLDNNLQFKDNSTINLNDSITSWNWDFGDNQTSTLKNPVHIYNTVSDYIVKLTVFSNFGCSDLITDSLRFYDHIPSPEIIRATIDNNRDVLLEWNPPKSGATRNYILERSSNLINFAYVATINPKLTNYYDRLQDIQNKSFTYHLIAEDSCSYKSPPSNIAKTILLKLDKTQDFPFLYWTQYLQWTNGVKEYHVELRDNKTGDFNSIAVVTPDSFYLDPVPRDNDTAFCYRIIAYRDDGIISISNINCFRPPFYLWVPNVFSPNHDNYNDSFEIIGKNIIQYQILIYDRWGEKVFSSNDLNISWDGTYKGAPCPVGEYFYEITSREGDGRSHNLQGEVLLIR